MPGFMDFDPYSICIFLKMQIEYKKYLKYLKRHQVWFQNSGISSYLHQMFEDELSGRRQFGFGLSKEVFDANGHQMHRKSRKSS